VTAPCLDSNSLRVVREALPAGRWVTTRVMVARTGLTAPGTREGLWAMVSLHEAVVRSIGKQHRYYWHRAPT